MGRRVEALKARSELQQGRLHQDQDQQPKSNSKKNKKGGSYGGGGGRKSLSGEAGAKLRVRALQQRKEALKYSVERLELEVLQKERELRKRLENA